MIQAKFKKSIMTPIILILIGLFLCVSMSVKIGNDKLFGIVLGIVMCIIGIAALFYNFNAFLSMENNHIIGKYGWFRTINCSISDIKFALPQNNMLTIELKNGRRIVIGGIVNSFEFCNFIYRTMSFESNDSPANLFHKLHELKRKRKRNIIITCCVCAFMFINIFLTVFLTDGRELYQFSKTDWSIMAVMGIVELFTIIVTFYYGYLAGRLIFSIEEIKYDLRRAIMLTHPLPSGNIKKVYAYDDYSVRLILYDRLNGPYDIYLLQKLNSNYSLETVSKTNEDQIDDKENFQNILESFIDITDKFSL